MGLLVSAPRSQGLCFASWEPGRGGGGGQPSLDSRIQFCPTTQPCLSFSTAHTWIWLVLLCEVIWALWNATWLASTH